MADESRLDDKARAAIESLRSKVYAGARRKDDRRIISGIIYVPRSGCRWKDSPAAYEPPRRSTITSVAGLSRITLPDGLLIAEFDGLPSSASQVL